MFIVQEVRSQGGPNSESNLLYKPEVISMYKTPISAIFVSNRSFEGSTSYMSDLTGRNLVFCKCVRLGEVVFNCVEVSTVQPH